MPYNTRRKSLSLPSLGIQLPNSSRSSSHRASPPSSASATSEHQPPVKKVKRSHSSASNVTTPTTPPRPSSLRFNDEQPKSAGRVADTPPPSPLGESGQTKVDTQGINDEVVVGVIEQLEKTGNRPHLLKELAAVLATSIPIVESSANPAAIISSRLAAYLKRKEWSALAKCPLNKVLVGTHPKRVYYFLTTCPLQEIPADTLSGPITARIISPSLSSDASEGEDLEDRSREQMSPSPELDLSFDDCADPFSHQPHPPTTPNVAHNRRAASPPLEREEREFTQMASTLQQRKRQATEDAADQSKPEPMEDVIVQEAEETEESAARKNSEMAAALFGQMGRMSDIQPSSPFMRPHLEIELPPSGLRGSIKTSVEEGEWGWSMKSPETVELEELDDLFGGY